MAGLKDGGHRQIDRVMESLLLCKILKHGQLSAYSSIFDRPRGHSDRVSCRRIRQQKAMGWHRPRYRHTSWKL